MNLKNCKFDRAKTGRFNLSEDELCILEGLLFPYSKFGGKSLLNEQPLESIRRIEDEGNFEAFLIALLESKKFQSGDKERSYIKESEIIVYYNMNDSVIGKVFNINFDVFHNFAQNQKKYAEQLGKLIDSAHDLIIDFSKDIEMDPEKKRGFYIKAKERLSKLRLSDLMITPELGSALFKLDIRPFIGDLC